MQGELKTLQDNAEELQIQVLPSFLGSLKSIALLVLYG